MTKAILGAAVGAVLGMSATASAAEYTVKFDGTDGEVTSLWYGYAHGGSNLGGNMAASSANSPLLLAHPTTDWYFGAGLLRALNLPADLAGATIQSAQFTMFDDWGGNGIYQNVQVYEIDTPADWKVGNGAQANRWPDSLIDNGAGRRVADWTGTSTNGREGTGVDWNGNVVTGVGANDTNYVSFGSTLPAFEDAALGDLVTTTRIVGISSTGALLPGEARGVTSADLTSLVQAWADGTADINDGFAFWMGNASEPADGDGNNTHGFAFDGDGGGLVIQYTPIPEPASLGLLALGGLTLLRRRRA